MPLAFLPSPARSVWHAGPLPLPLRAQALCVVAAILIALAITARRCRAAGAARGDIADIAAWAIPAGLVPAAVGLVLAHTHPGVLQAVRTWDQLAGFPGAVAFGVAGAWSGSRRMRGWTRRAPAPLGAPDNRKKPEPGDPGRVPAGKARSRARLGLAPVAGAAAPALLFGHAIAMLGLWLTQRGYGKPTALPW